MEKQESMTAISNLMREHYGDLDVGPERLLDPYRTLINCVLSHRTRDENSSRASRNLFSEIDGPLDLLDMDHAKLKDLIHCSGFYNQKARNIIAISHVLVYDSQNILFN